MDVHKINESSSDEQNCSSSLDPTDWSSFRSLAYRMIDQSINYLQDIRNKPIYNIVPIPTEVCDQLNDSLPANSMSLADVCEEFNKNIFPYPLGNGHPRFWGWAAGGGTAGTIISQLMIGTMNVNCGGGAQASTLVERQVLKWCREIFGFPDTFGGLLVSGTSMATIIALTVARNHALGNNYDIRLQGIIGGPRLVGYTSFETHFCIMKAFELLGLGRNALRLIPVDKDYSIDINELEKAINEDLSSNYVPFCIVGNAGTVSTGSIDDFLALKTIALKYKLWFHIDGAFGALAVLDESLKPMLAGIEQADSLAFDFHKWLHVPFDAGCVLLRDKSQQISTFSSHGRFLTNEHVDQRNGYELYFQHGPELSRGFRALNVWFTLKEYGIKRLGQKIHENCKQAAYLATLLSKYTWIRVHRPIRLNVVCFRVQPDGWNDETKVDKLNDTIVVDVQQSGTAVPSTATLDSRLYIRCCVMNHRTTYDDCYPFIQQIVSVTKKYVDNI